METTQLAAAHHAHVHVTRKGGLIFALSFPVFFAIALGGLLLGRPWREWLPGAEGVESLVGGVKAAIYTFMSHLI
jgi:light-harvesting complex 1 beta chain